MNEKFLYYSFREYSYKSNHSIANEGVCQARSDGKNQAREINIITLVSEYANPQLFLIYRCPLRFL